MSDFTVSSFAAGHHKPDTKSVCHLKLVSSNPNLGNYQDPTLSTDSTIHRYQNSNQFAASITGSDNHFTLHVNDGFHYLHANLILQVKHSCHEQQTATVACFYPVMDVQALNNLIWDDETLYGIIVIGFQLKILEQLLLFCAEHDAGILHILVDETHAPELEIYRNFIQSEDTVSTLRGKKCRMALPTDHESYDRLVDFITETKLKFKQSLWQDQKTNPAIRHYLKMQPLNATI